MHHGLGVCFLLGLFLSVSAPLSAEEAVENVTAVAAGEDSGLGILWRQYRNKEITREEYIRRARLVMKGEQKQEEAELSQGNST